MRIRILVLGLVCAAIVCGQRRHHFSWQNYCFNNPGSPVCPGRDYAVKRPRAWKNGPATQSGITTADLAAGAELTAPILDGGIDWRFADPLADALGGFDFRGLAGSPLAHNLIAQLGASQGLTEADMQKVFTRLSGVDRVALSMRDGRIVAMVIGRVTGTVLLAPDAGFKAVPVSSNAVLMGHSDAVDQAVRRLPASGPAIEAAGAGGEQTDRPDFWAGGKAALAGPDFGTAGMTQFSMTVSVRGRLTSDLSFEFEGAPGTNVVESWKTAFGATTLEDNILHVRTSMEIDEAQSKFSRIVSSPLGQRLAGLVKAAQYLPVNDPNAPKQFKPVISGLN